MLWDFFLKFVKFGIVGFLCMLIDFGLTYFVKETLRLSRYVANSTGFIISAVINYFLNRAWTFRNHDPNMAQQFTIFIIVATLGLLFNTLVLYYFHHNKKLNFYFSKFLATGVTVIWNFLGNRFLTFGDWGNQIVSFIGL
ncbi:MAG: GtrA family protein [Bacteroidota bacterium]|nr:GtrA family protein [Bacteroidota bacterium]